MSHSVSGGSVGGGPRGWFEGTMEVISGMAPRPSTPQPHHHHHHHHQSRSLSAPNSPARQGMIPGINRLPSQDSLDRSIHNESGHGKSTAQIIRGLKASNSALSTKNATMEAQFMNQLSEVTKSFEERQKYLEDTLRKKDRQIAALEAKNVAVNDKLKDKDSQLSKIKEESAFQRHTISDLKNQLYQLQTEMEEAEFDKRDDLEQLELDNREMARIIEELQQQNEELHQQAEDGFDARQRVEELEQELERVKREKLPSPSAPASPPEEKKEDDDSATKETSTEAGDVLGPLPMSDKPHQVWKQLEQTQGELEKHRRRLLVTQDSLKDLQLQKDNLAQEHSRRVEELEAEINASSADFQRRESQLQLRIEDMESKEELIEELRAELEERDDTIAQLNEEIYKFEDQVAELSDALSKVRQDSVNQEHYRRDEAEDLRILHDAQEQEIEKLKKSLDDAQRELEVRDQELEEQEAVSREKLETNKKELKEMEDAVLALQKEVDESTQELDLRDKELGEKEKELAECQVKLLEALKQKEALSSASDKAVSDRIIDLESQLESSRTTIQQLQEDLDDSETQHRELVNALKASVESLTSDKAIAEKRVAEMKRQLDTLSRDRDTAVAAASDKSEIYSLRKQIDEITQQLAQKSEAERVALDKLQKYDEVTLELGTLRRARDINAAEIASLRAKLSEAETRLAETLENSVDSSEVELLQSKLEEVESKASSNEARIVRESDEKLKKLRDTIQVLETSTANTMKVKKQLHEAQKALVELEYEKQNMATAHLETLSAVEKEKDDLRRQLEQKEVELSENDQGPQIDELKSTNSRLRQELQSLQSEIAELQSTASDVASRADLESVTEAKKAVEMSLKTLKKEKDTQIKTLRAKLKDRDTTIAALVRSSVALEDKVSAMEMDISRVRSADAVDRSVVEEELEELKKSIETYKDRQSKLSSEIASLQKSLATAQNDADRWRLALQEESSSDSEYRYQIALLRKEIDENYDKLQERDNAIEKLVNQSMSQESHVRDLKTRIASLTKEIEVVRSNKSRFDDSAVKAELRRLKQESEIFAGQIIEQDDELEMLKRDLQIRDEQCMNLRSQVSAMKANENKVASLNQKVQELQTELQDRDSKLSEARQELEDLRQKPATSSADARKIADLQAELDEAKEANEFNLSELRSVRRQLWEAKALAGEAQDMRNELAQARYALNEQKNKTSALVEEAKRDARRELFEAEGEDSPESLREELEKALAENDALELKMAQQLDMFEEMKTTIVSDLEKKLKESERTIEVLKRHSSDVEEEQVRVFQQEIADLRHELGEKSKALESAEVSQSKLSRSLENAEASIRLLNDSLETAEASKRKLTEALDASEQSREVLEQELTESMHAVSLDDGDYAESNLSLRKEIKALHEELEELRANRDSTKSLMEELDQEKSSRDIAVQNVVNSYERQISQINSTKDAAIDELRKELTASRGKTSDDMGEMSNGLRALQSENEHLRQQLEFQLQEKDQQIFALEHTLHAQEQVVDSMRMEMDQLQSGMENATERRRGEVEELQQEIIDIESRAMKQEREIIALKMQLEESKLEHKAEVVRMRETISSMEKESPLAKTVAELQNDDRILEVRERLEQLKWRNTTLQEENLKLGGRLERAVIELKSMEAERVHTADMEKDVARLRRQVKQLEDLLSSRASHSSPSRKPRPSASTDKENVQAEKAEEPKAIKKTSQASPARRPPKLNGSFRFFKKNGAQAKRSQAESSS